MTAWLRSQEKVPAGIPETPPGDPADPAYQASVRRGFEQFVGLGGAGCAKCHQDFGRSDFFQYDAWGLAVRATDLTRGEYRWGRDDLAARVRHGIPGANMPANPLMTDGQVRDVVNLVRELPFPNRLPADVREAVYPPGR
jgi:mono/diheme cytochrome c family protein